MNAALTSPEGQVASAILAEDEVKFTETRRLSAFPASEEVIFDFAAAD